eukprot:m.25238 g.25238  ORF g.25238 m.25238 type:complete len:188 (+) comp11574_c0_seq1:56-619(+)
MSEEAEVAVEVAEPPTLDVIAESIAKEHSRYLDLNNNDYLRKELVQSSDAADSLLAQIDECTTVVNTITAERDELVTQVLPALQSNCERLVAMFMVIENLETLVASMRANLDEVEKEVAAVEKPRTVTSMLSKVKLSGFFSRKSTAPTPKAGDDWVRPTIVDSKQFFSPSSATKLAAETPDAGADSA